MQFIKLLQSLNILRSQTILIFLFFSCVNCLSYWKNDIIRSNEIVSREKDKIETNFIVNSKIANNVLKFEIKEESKTYEKVKYKQEIITEKKISRNGFYNYGSPQEPKRCVSFVLLETNEHLYKDDCVRDYWTQVFIWPLGIAGVPYLWTIPIAILDWTTLPFRTLFDGYRTEFPEKSELIETKIDKPKENTFFILTGNDNNSKSQEYEIKNGIVSISLLKIENPILLWKSDVKNKNYEYSIQRDGKVLFTNFINGNDYHENKEFKNLVDAYEIKRDKASYNRCTNRFPKSTLVTARTYIIPDTGWYVKSHEFEVRLILKSVCEKYWGTDAGEQCANDFISCVDTIRNIDNKNLKYE